MARYKPIDMRPKLIPVDFTRQILPGSFEYALCYVIDHERDLSEFDQRFRNDEGERQLPPRPCCSRLSS